MLQTRNCMTWSSCIYGDKSILFHNSLCLELTYVYNVCGMLLAPTCKIIYVYMQHIFKYVHHNYVNMQDKYVNVMVIESFERVLHCRTRGPGFKPQQRQKNISVTLTCDLNYVNIIMLHVDISCMLLAEVCPFGIRISDIVWNVFLFAFKRKCLV